MDLVAYGGAAAGILMAVTQFRAGHVGLGGCLAIILLAADFFIPMRQLGSFFHIAMNGMASSDKIFRLLDLPEPAQKTLAAPRDCTIRCENLHFSYEADREILKGVDFAFPMGGFTAIVGESGCGKSTIASILMGRNRNYTGSVTVGGVPLSELSEDSLLRCVAYVSHQSYLFKGTVRDNLQMGRPGAEDCAMWEVLGQVNLAGFLRSEQGLDTRLAERASNLSGGQCQRLALARALLHDSPVYIFDEATSNIDVESENDIMAQTHRLAKTKTVLLISHRLANVADADNIYVMDGGNTIILLFDLAMLFASALLYQRQRIGFDGVLLSTVAMMSSFGPVVALANLGSTLQNTFAAGNRVLDILEETPVVQEITGRPETAFTGAAAERVSFAYGEEPILDDLSLQIPAHRIVGIVGRSGSGKSTLLKLFMRFWEPQSGEIQISERSVGDINTANLRELESLEDFSTPVKVRFFCAKKAPDKSGALFLVIRYSCQPVWKCP